MQWLRSCLLVANVGGMGSKVKLFGWFANSSLNGVYPSFGGMRARLFPPLLMPTTTSLKPSITLSSPTVNRKGSAGTSEGWKDTPSTVP